MSFQSQLLYFVMKNRHLMSFRLKPETWDQNTSIPAFCEFAEASNRYTLMASMFPEGTQALDEVCRFIQKNLETNMPMLTR